MCEFMELRGIIIFGNDNSVLTVLRLVRIFRVLRLFVFSRGSDNSLQEQGAAFVAAVVVPPPSLLGCLVPLPLQLRGPGSVGRGRRNG